MGKTSIRTCTIIAGLTLAGAATTATASPMSLELLGLAHTMGQMAKPSRVYGALSSGIDFYRRGEYERAAAFFQQAQEGMDGLAPPIRQEFQQELNKYLGLNNAALKARGDCAEQLRKAEQAVQAGHTQEADQILKPLTTCQFLSSADKQKVQQLLERVRPAGTGDAFTPGIPAITLARTKLQQGRALLNKANFEAAEEVAHRVLQLKVVYNLNEDTPAKLLEDVKKARNDPKWLLNAARTAYQRGELDRAEELARLSEKAAPFYQIHLWGDSPSKLLKDVQAARLKPAVPHESAKPVEAPPKKETPSRFGSIKNLFHRSAPAEKPAESPKPEAPAKNVSQATPPSASVGGTAVSAVQDRRDAGPTHFDPSALPGSPYRGITTPPADPAPASVVRAPEQPAAVIPVGKKEVTVHPSFFGGEGSGGQGKKFATDTQSPHPSPLPQGEKEKLPAAPKDEAVALLKDARRALQDGDLKRARDLVAQAGAVKKEYNWWDDTPQKVLKDIDRVAAKAASAAAAAEAAALIQPTAPGTPDQPATPVSASSAQTAAAKAPKTKEDPRALLKQARELYKLAKYDEAEKLACRAKTLTVKWGLFEDSPDKLQLDISKARAQRDREESIRLLVEARRFYEKGHWEEAKARAFRAERLHGPYSIWDLGDRPQKLLAEIQVAEVKSRKTKPAAAPQPKSAPAEEGDASAVAKVPTPPLPAKNESPRAAVKKGEPIPPAEALALRKGEPIPPTDAQKMLARQLLVQARTCLQQGDYAQALNLADQVELMRALPNKLDEDSPAAIRRDVLAMQTAGQSSQPEKPAPAEASAVAQAKPAESKPEEPKAEAPATPMPLPIRPDVGNTAKTTAQRLLAQARQLQSEGRLLEARQKALEAQKAGAGFESEEDRPERALLQLAGQAAKQIESLMNRATDIASTAADPAQFEKAEEKLLQAHQLAVGFALDTHPIDNKRVWMRQMRDRTLAAAPGNPPSTPSGTAMAQQPEESPQQRGRDLLDKARLELRHGHTTTARQLAGEAFKGPYDIQPEAEMVLRSIDAEEFNQSCSAANRSFEAALSAYRRGEYTNAAAIARMIDMRLLEPHLQTRYREIMQTTEMQQSVAQANGASGGGDSAVPPGAGQATVSDMPQTQPLPSVPSEERLSQKVAALQEVQFQKLHEENRRVQREALERIKAGEYDRALEILKGYLEGLRDAQIDAGRAEMLRRPIEYRLEQFQMLRKYHELNAAHANQTKSFNEQRSRVARLEELKKEQVASLMKKFNALYKEGKYREAEMAALQAHELDPDNPAADAAVHIAQRGKNLADYNQIKADKEDMVLKGLDDAEKEGPFVGIDEPLKFGKDYIDIKSRREKQNPGRGIESGVKSEKERAIERQLTQPISVDFRDKPLREVIGELGQLSGVNIVPDATAIEKDGISLDQPLSLKVGNISLKAALNLLLRDARLTYVIKDEVLQITTSRRAVGGLRTRTYPVADIVVPVPDNPTPDVFRFDKALERMSGLNSGSGMQNATPYTGPQALPGGQPVGSMKDGAAAGGFAGNRSGSGNPAGTPERGNRAASQTREDVLIDLITKTVAPESWSSMGGPGTIDYFPMGMALVVNQTPDIQEQIADLLTALRRLQDIEVTIEVRFIALSESFYERMGVDFNLNVLTDTTKFEPQIVSQAFKPAGYIQDFTPSRFVAGWTPAGTFTHDLDIPIRSTSFWPTMPPFGQFAGVAPGADGGLSLGLAFLSDIQVFLFLEAAQGDRRTNIMQAPKLTMYNGQMSNIAINDINWFVLQTGFTWVNGQPFFQPNNAPLPTGINLQLQPVVSADRRFVRITLNPTFTESVQNVQLFPFPQIYTPFYDGGAAGQPVIVTQYLQQPEATTISVNTTVSVPDGGTVLLGGLKLMREGRTEMGPPVLSKLPYVNRLFKNVGYGRDTESLMIMVTPRIIINEEEEERAFGGQVSPGP